MEQLSKWIDQNKDNIVNMISESVKIPSVTGSVYAKEALKYFINIAKSDNFKTKYTQSEKAAHIEIGDCSRDFVGILAHVDVVPANDNEWNVPPFSGAFDNEYVYGRGVQDDKGPFVLAYYAIKALIATGHEFNRGVRMILGTQEEGGDWSDIEEYFREFDTPSLGFTPDADFPLIYAEKGILRLDVCGKFDNYEKISLTGGSVVNSVPSFAKVNEMEFTGTPVHAKDANLGDSAAHKALSYLNDTSTNKFFKALATNFAYDSLGHKIGISCESVDEGPLTVNLGVISVETNGDFRLSFDIRYIRGVDHVDIAKKFEEIFSDYHVVINSNTEPLYIDRNSEQIKILEEAYRVITQDYKTPLKTTGGGTYAKTFPNCVAYGPLFPGDEVTLHQKNERAKIDSLIKACKVYAHAIKELTK